MKIHNVRLGFATNSSSSHSVLILPHGMHVPGSHDDGDFGWDMFVCADEDSKARYLASQRNRGQGADGIGYVDHQSVWDAEGMRISNRLGLSESTADIMARLFQSDRVVVLGGNDNGDESREREEEYERDGAISLGTGAWSHLADPKGHHVLFDRSSGNRVRFSLDGSEAPTKGTWPELVDVKITDFCPYGCSYCYQGSTTEGRHAPLSMLKQLAQRFRESGVFEVALGGGEPTLHPDFLEIVDAFKQAGCVVNTTSRNVAFWEKHKDSGVSAVAVSVDTAKQAADVVKRLPHAHIQVVAGAVSSDELTAIIGAVGYGRLTLLGYKTTGRGAEAMGGLPVMNEPDQAGWIAAWARAERLYQESQAEWSAYNDAKYTAMRRANYDSAASDAWKKKNPEPTAWQALPQLAVDTALVQACGDALKAEGVPKVTYDAREGAFSLYIDAVEEQYGPCSYAPSMMRALDIERLWEAFATMDVLQ